MVEKGQARPAGSNLIFQAKRSRRGVRIHDKHEDKQAGFASSNLRLLVHTGLSRSTHPESGRSSCRRNEFTRQYTIRPWTLQNRVVAQFEIQLKSRMFEARPYP